MNYRLRANEFLRWYQVSIHIPILLSIFVYDMNENRRRLDFIFQWHMLGWVVQKMNRIHLPNELVKHINMEIQSCFCVSGTRLTWFGGLRTLCSAFYTLENPESHCCPLSIAWESDELMTQILEPSAGPRARSIYMREERSCITKFKHRKSNHAGSTFAVLCRPSIYETRHIDTRKDCRFTIVHQLQV